MEKLTFEECKKIAKELENNVDYYGDILKRFPKNEIGLTLDVYKKTDEYKNARLMFDRYWKQFQTINKYTVKNYKKESRELAQEKRLKKCST
jgi:hypothetical protein